MNTSSQQEKSFAILLVSPSILVLLITTTFPILYLIWSSFQNINLSMPLNDGFAGLENYIEMRGLVNQNIFFKKKELERELEMTYPDRFISRYSMVSFHQIPYSIVKARGIIQEKILSTFSSSNSSVSMKNYKEMMNVNIYALTELTHLFLKDMVARKEGGIINFPELTKSSNILV